jgi:hypothetical protein
MQSGCRSTDVHHIKYRTVRIRMVTWFRFCKCSNAITVRVLVAWSHDLKRPQRRPSFSAMRFFVIVVIYVYKPEIILDMVRVPLSDYISLQFGHAPPLSQHRSRRRPLASYRGLIVSLDTAELTIWAIRSFSLKAYVRHCRRS